MNECKPVEVPLESKIEIALTDQYGPRCGEHGDPSCYAAWLEYDDLRRATAENERWQHNYEIYCQSISALEQQLTEARAAARFCYKHLEFGLHEEQAVEQWPWLEESL